MARKKRKSAKQIEANTKLVEYIQKCRKAAMDASKGRREAMAELWNAFQNKQDFSKKKRWQAKMFAPKTWMKIEKAAGEVKRAALQINKLFKLAIDDEQEWDDEKKGLLLKEMPRVEAKFKRAIEKSNFSNVYSEMAKSSFLLGVGWPKPLWEGDKGGLYYQNVEALNVHVAPDYKPYEDERASYLIEDQEMDLAKLKSAARKINKAAGKQIFDMEEIEKIGEDYKKIEEDSKENARKGFSEYEKVNKKVGLWQFWGDYINEDEDEIEENIMCWVANEKYLIRKQQNPFIHEKAPYIPTFPLAYPHRGTAGISLVEPTMKLQYAYNNLFNQYLDNMNFSVNKMFEYDPNRINNPKELMSVYPGKLFEKEGAEQVIQEIKMSPVGKEAITGLDTLNREMQEGSSVTDFTLGMPSKKEKTLGEVEIKTAESRGLFDTIARDLEQNSIKPLLEMSYSLLVQHEDFEPIEGKYIIKVGGLTLLLMQKDMIEKISQVLGIVGKVPQLMMKTDLDDLWKKYLSVLNLSDVYIEPAEQQQMMPTGQPGAEGGVEQRAAEDARNLVAQMNPQQILRLTG